MVRRQVVLGLLVPFLAHCGGNRVEQIAELEGDATAGADVFAVQCTVCHGDDGTGGTGADLTAISLSKEEIIVQLFAAEDGMPSFAELSDQECADVTAFVLTL